MKFGAGPVLARWTDRREGDLGPALDPAGSVSRGQRLGPAAELPGRTPRTIQELERRRRAIVDRSWSWITQVHGGGVVVVREPGDGAGAPGDALVSDHPAGCVAVFTADCAPIALSSPEGVFGAVHAGWRGLLAGVVASAAEAMRSLGASRIDAALGPCIHAECYEFSPEELDRVADRLGSTVRGVTAIGRPALDIPRAVRTCLRASDIDLVADLDICTACSPEHFSFRARGERQRMALVVWPA